MAKFGDGLATGTDLGEAAGAAVEQALAHLDGPPDLMFVFVSGDDPDDVERAGAQAMERAPDAVTLGCSASGVIGAGKGVEGSAAVSIWAATLPDARVAPFRLETLRTQDRLVVTGMSELQPDDRVAVLLADPYTFPVDAFVDQSTAAFDGLPLIGGLAGGAGGGESIRLFLDGTVLSGGAVGVLLGGALNVSTVVSQGCRPVGPPMAVTACQDNIIAELAGTPALTKLEQILAELDEGERTLAEGGLEIGFAMNEYADEHDRGDFLVRGLIGVDSRRAALAVGDVARVGQTVRFQVRDEATADEELGRLLRTFPVDDLGPAQGALLFSCNGRGSDMFASADHDVLAVRGGLGTDRVAGFFASGEIGPVAGRNHVHSFTACVLAFGPDPTNDELPENWTSG